MGYQLWMSPVTGYRRQGTRYESLRAIFQENASLKSVFEPVLYCKESDSADDAKRALVKRDFDTTCVVDSQNMIIGKINSADLGQGLVSEYICEITAEEIVDETSSLVDLLDTLLASNFKYVRSNGIIRGIVTRSDLNKPIPRTYLFGVVSLVELHMKFWVNYHHSEKIWMKVLKDERQKLLNEQIQKRKQTGDYLNAIDCTQFCDKKDILRDTPEFLALFEISKNKYKQFMERLENIRNDIAHSQSSIIEKVSWEVLASTIATAESFLKRSDDEIEKDGTERANGIEEDDVLVPIGS